MRITCEHCGTGINTDKDKRCPNCGASYSNNKEYKKYKEIEDKRTEYEFREKEANLETRQITNDMLKNSAKFGKHFFAVPIIMFVVIVCIMGSLIYFGNKKMGVIGGEKEITVGFNETASNSKYDMKVDEVTVVTEDKITTFMMQDENTTYYGFHVVFKNKTDYWNNLSEINCTYTDDKGNDDIKAKRFTTSDMSGFTTEQVTYSGYIYCGLPNYTQDVNVKFENTTIQIKDYKELIK